MQTTTPPPVVEDITTVSLWSKVQAKVTALVGDKGPIILWIGIAVIGLLGLLVIAKLMSGGSSQRSNTAPDVGRHDDHDGLSTTPENNHGPDWLHDDQNHDTHNAEHSTGEVDTHATTPDWLKETESPFGEEDVLSKEVASNTIKTDTPVTTPDWMHTEAPVSPTTTEVSTPVETAHTDVPDWLKTSDHEETPIETPIMSSVEPEVVTPITPTASMNTTHEDVPDWLK